MVVRSCNPGPRVSGQSDLLCEIVRHCLQKREKDQLGRLSFITYSVLPFEEKEDEVRTDSVVPSEPSAAEPLVLSYLGFLLQPVHSCSPENGPLTLPQYFL